MQILYLLYFRLPGIYGNERKCTTAIVVTQATGSTEVDVVEAAAVAVAQRRVLVLGRPARPRQLGMALRRRGANPIAAASRSASPRRLFAKLVEFRFVVTVSNRVEGCTWIGRMADLSCRRERNISVAPHGSTRSSDHRMAGVSIA